MSDWKQIGRNPFARETLYRRSVSHPFGCSECGKFNGKGRLFEYGSQTDGIATRITSHKGKFCSKSCHDAYHGE